MKAMRDTATRVGNLLLTAACSVVLAGCNCARPRGEIVAGTPVLCSMWHLRGVEPSLAECNGLALDVAQATEKLHLESALVFEVTVSNTTAVSMALPGWLLSTPDIRLASSDGNVLVSTRDEDHDSGTDEWPMKNDFMVLEPGMSAHHTLHLKLQRAVARWDQDSDGMVLSDSAHSFDVAAGGYSVQLAYSAGKTDYALGQGVSGSLWHFRKKVDATPWIGCVRSPAYRFEIIVLPEELGVHSRRPPELEDLRRASVYGQLQNFRAILDCRPSLVKARLAGGATLLHIEAQNGCLEFMEALIEAGASLDARDAVGRTPLDRAMAAEMNDAVELIQRQILRKQGHYGPKP